MTTGGTILSPKEDSGHWYSKRRLRRAVDVLLIGAMVYVALMALGVVRRGGTFEPGTPGPEFRVQSVWNNQEIRLADLRGKAVVLSFFSTGCGPCRRRIGSLARIQQQGGDNLQVILISGDPPDTLRSWLAAQQVNLEAGIDRSNAHGAYRVRSIPYTVILDPSGKIQKDIIGGVRWSDVAPWIP